MIIKKEKEKQYKRYVMLVQKLLLSLRIHPGEGRIVGIYFFFSLLLGIVTNFAIIIPLSFFLKEYPSYLLSYTYIASGAGVFLAGLVFSYFEKRFPFFLVLISLLFFLSLSLIFFWALLLRQPFHGLSMILIIWANILMNFLGIIFGSLLLEVFNLQQAKRLFGLIGSGQSLGGLISGLCTPFLTNSIGTTHILLLSGILLIISCGSIFSIKSNSRKPKEPSLEIQTEENPSFTKLQNKKYIYVVFLLNAINVMLYFVFDLFFNKEIKTHFHEDIAIANFLGVTSAASYALYLFAGFFLFSFFLTRFGLIISLLIHSVSTAFFMIVLLLIFNRPLSSDFIFFSFLTGIVLCERTLRNSISKQALLLFLQPLSKKERSWTQIETRAVVSPISTCLIGGALIGIQHIFGITLTSMSVSILLLSIGSILGTFSITKDYLKVLVHSITKRSILRPEFTTFDKECLQEFKKYLTSPYPEEVIYFLDIIENTQRATFSAALEQTLQHPSQEVLIYSLSKVEEYKIHALKDPSKKLYLETKDLQVKEAACLAWACTEDPKQLSTIIGDLCDLTTDIAKQAVIVFVKYGSEIEKEKYIQLLQAKITSPLALERTRCAEILAEIDPKEKCDLLLTLLQDTDTQVLSAACRAAMRQEDPRLFPVLIDHLKKPRTHAAAFETLISMHMPFFSYMSSSFEHFDPETQLTLVKLLGFMPPHKQIILFLKAQLPKESRPLSHAALISLKNQGYKDPKNSSLFSDLLSSESQWIFELYKFLPLFANSSTELLHCLILRELEIAEERLFILLTFKYPTTSIMQVWEGLETGNEDIASYSLEILSNLLKRKDFQEIEHCLTYFSLEPPTSSLERPLLELMEKTAKSSIPAIRASIVYTIGLLGLKNLKPLVLEFETQGDPLFCETKSWALQQLE